MYFRSAPLQKTPPSPRRTTARTAGSRASWSPALRKSRAVCDVERVEALAAVDRENADGPVPSRSGCVCIAGASADARAAARPRARPAGADRGPVSRMTRPGRSEMQVADDRRVPPQGVGAERREHGLGRLGATRRSRPCPRWPRAADRCRAAPRPRGRRRGPERAPPRGGCRPRSSPPSRAAR